MTKRPNILLIHSDQHRYDCIGANENEIVQTPNLDRLIREGCNFRNAFSTIPICTPARASLMTGTWPSTHRSVAIPGSDFYQPAKEGLQTVTECLSKEGYSVKMLGKYHQELKGDPTDYGVDEFVRMEGYEEYLRSNGIELNDIGGYWGKVLDIPSESHTLAWQADGVLDLLENAKSSDKPFFVRWDPPEPHLPYSPTREYYNMYKDVSIPEWPSFPDTLEGKPEAQKRQHEIWGTGGWSWDQWEPLVRMYYGLITEMDHHIGRVLNWLDDNGLYENTIVIYSTDHGDFCGGHGFMDKHFNMYDDVLKVPLIIRAPGLIEEGINEDSFVSNEVDIAHSILSCAQVEVPETFEGRDLLQVASGVGRKDCMISQYFGAPSAAYSLRMLRTDIWKYVWHPIGIDELYDLKNDPGELRNLINEEIYKENLKELRVKLVDEMEAIDDHLCNEWTKILLLGHGNVAEKHDFSQYHEGGLARPESIVRL